MDPSQSYDSISARAGTPVPAGLSTPPGAAPNLVLPPAAASLVGTVIDRKFEILSLLGSGGMGCVFKARHVGLDRTVALKMLHPHLVTNKHVVDRFLQEARTESELKHPNILNVQSFLVTADGCVFLSMDYLEGETLDAVIAREGKLDPQRARDIFVQICQGLTHAHSKGVVHRDLKPSNVMLVEANGSLTAKLVDFGIAKLVGNRADQGMTKTGAIIGSPAYMSPEQCMSKPVDARSDIYSMGCLMYECLSGHVPFEAATDLEVLCKHISEHPQPFHRMSDLTVGSDLEDIVFRCMSKDPAARFQSTEELLSSLENADCYTVTRSALELHKIEPPPEIKFAMPPKRRDLKVPLICGIALTCLLVTVAWRPVSNAVQLRIAEANEKKAEEIAGRLSSEHLDALFNLAQAANVSGQTERSKELNKQIAEALLQNFGRYSPSLQQHAIDVIKTAYANDQQIEASQLRVLVHKLRGLHRQREAEQAIEACLAVAVDQERVLGFVEKAAISADAQDYKVALHALEGAVRELSTNPKLSNESVQLGNILETAGEYASKTGDYKLSSVDYAKSAKLANSPEQTGYRLMKQAENLFSAQETPLAEQTASDALETVKPLQTNKPALVAEIHRAYGDALIAAKLAQPAEKQFVACLELASSAHIGWESVVRAECGLADACFQQGKLAQAQALYQKVLVAISEHPLPGIPLAKVKAQLAACQPKV